MPGKSYDESLSKAIDLTKEKIRAITNFVRNLLRGKPDGGSTS